LDVLSALHARKSVRGFRPDPVDRATIEAILSAAARSPSASNTQPWRVYVCAGDVRDRLSLALLEAHEADSAHEDYRYYPSTWSEPYLTRRRQVGKELYTLLGVAKGDSAAMQRQYARNYSFFGAPAGLFFTLDRRLDGQSAWLDLGMFMHGIMLAALAHGLSTCAQQAFARYHAVVRQYIHIPESEVLVCGMSMGYADQNEPANQLSTAREPVAAFAGFHGL
jgi:nitroreductase